jgi:hypothetical protein
MLLCPYFRNQMSSPLRDHRWVFWKMVRRNGKIASGVNVYVLRSGKKITMSPCWMGVWYMIIPINQIYIYIPFGKRLVFDFVTLSNKAQAYILWRFFRHCHLIWRWIFFSDVSFMLSSDKRLHNELERSTIFNGQNSLFQWPFSIANC